MRLCFSPLAALFAFVLSSALVLFIPNAQGQTPTATGLLAHWNFDESPGANIAAELINNLDATLTPVGASIEAGGIAGNALRVVRASDGAAVVGDHLNFQDSPFTISAWIKTTADITDRDLGIVGKHKLGVLNGYWLGANNSGPGMPNGRATLYSGDESFVTTSSQPVSTTIVNDGAWHHLVATHDPNGRRRIFVDGTPFEADLAGSTNFASSAPLLIGSYTHSSGTGQDLSFDGLIDEVQIYNRALLDSEIDFLLANPGQDSPGPQPPSITAQPVNLLGQIDSTASFAVTASGDGTLTYQWQHNGADLNGATSTSLDLNNLTLANAGSYSVVVASPYGSITSQVAVLSLPAANGLLAHWKFDESPGATVADESVNNLDATLTPAGASFEAGGISGNALRIVRASDGAAVVGDHLNFQDHAFTISAWIKTTTDITDRDLGIVGKHKLGVLNGYWLGANNSGPGGVGMPNGRATLYSGTNTVVTPTAQPVSSTLVNDGQWHHLVATHDPNGRRRIFVDGTPFEADLAGSTNFASSAPLLIGSYTHSSGTGQDLSFDGLIDEVQIYNRVLLDTEVDYLLANPGQASPGPQPPSITSQPQNLLGQIGGNASFSVSATGDGTLNYQWRHDGVDVNGATGTTLDLTNLTLANAGSYSVIVTNLYGTTTSQVAVLSLPTPTGLLAHWRFDESPGANVADESINNLDATLTPAGASLEVGGIAGNALRIVRDDDGAAIVGNHLGFHDRPFTISTWIKTTNNSLDLGIVTKHYIFVTNGYWLGANNSGVGMPLGRAAFFSGSHGIVSPSTQPVSTTVVNDGQWHHVVVTYDPTGQRRLFVDGLPAEADLAGAPNIPSDAPLMIGAYAHLSGSGRSLNFDGLIDEVQIYDRVLEDAEISFLQANPGQPSPGFLPPMITEQPISRSTNALLSTSFAVTATGLTPLSYQWWRNGVMVPNATNASLPLSNVNTNHAGTYHVVITNAAGSVTSAPVSLTLQRLASILTWPNPAPITYGTDVGANELDASANNPGTFSYTPTAGTVPPAGTNDLSVSFVPADPSVYLPANTTRSLVVNPAPLTITADDKSREFGQDNPPFTIRFEGFVNGEDHNVLNTQPVTGTTANINSLPGNYPITVSSASANNYSITHNNGVLNIFANPPAITQQPIHRTTNALLSTSFAVTATGTAPLTFQWWHEGNLLPGATNANLPLNGVNTNHAGNYSVVVSNVAGSVTSAPAGLSVQRLASLLTWPDPAPITYGTPVSVSELNASANNPGTFTYTPGSATTLPARTNVLSVSFLPDDTSVYLPTNATRALVVNPAPLIITADDKSREFGQSNPALSVRFDGFVIGEDHNALDTQPVAATTANINSLPGNYPITIGGASATNYSITHSNGVLSIFANPPAITQQPVGQTTDALLSTSFSVTASGSAPLAYQWWHDGNLIPGATNANLLLNALNTTHIGNYRVVVTNVVGSVTSAPASLVVQRLASILTWTNPAPITYGTSLDTNQLNASANNSGIFTYTPTNGSVLPAGTNVLSVSFQPDDQTVYLPDNTSRPLLINPAPLTITADNKSREVGQTNPPLTLRIDGFVNGEDHTDLDSQPVLATTANINSPTGNYPITVSGASATNYSVVHNNGILTVFADVPVIAQQPSSQIKNALLPVTFSVAAGGSAPLNYQWFHDGNIIPGATNANLVLSSVNTTDFGNYHAVVSNLGGSVASASASLIVLRLPSNLTWNPSPITYGTPLGTNQLNASADNSGTFTYAPSAGVILPAGSNNLSVSFQPDDLTVYSPNNVSRPLVVNAAPLLITAEDKSRQVGHTNPVLTVRFDGFVNGEGPVVLATPPMPATAADINSPPGDYPITVSGAAAANYSITHSNGVLNVFAVPPVLAAIGNQTIDEGQALSLTVTTSDDGYPGRMLIYSLPVKPAGMTIEPSSGLITWNTSESAGPSTNNVRVRVTDNGNQALADERDFTAVVNEVNAPPSLLAATNHTVVEGVELVFTNLATDADSPANLLSFSLGTNAPVGATINATNGIFRWTPTEADGPGSFSFDLVVTDDGVPSLSTTQQIVITVTETNQAPALATVPDLQLNEGQTINLALAATDADLPANQLTFHLVAGPAGMTVNPNPGSVSWTPSELQAPSTNTVTVDVRDGGTPERSASQTFQIVVLEVNQPPTLAAIPDPSADELVELTLNLVADDADRPANNLTFQLLTKPEGMVIGATDGALTWTPTEAQGPGDHPVLVRVVDDGFPSLSVTQSFTVSVGEVNIAPSLAAVATKTVKELETLSFNLAASDPDEPLNSLTFGLVSAPAGVTVSAGGSFQWTPAAAQGPSTNTIVVRVQDNGNPPLSDTNAFTVIANENNRSPVLAAIGDQTIDEGDLFSLTAVASDNDIPQNVLTFSLPNGPAGMTIDPTNGVISWPTSESHGPTTNSVTVRVEDNGVPVLFDEQTFSVFVNEVNEAPTLQPQPTYTVQENVTLTITNMVTDVDLPANRLTFSLVNSPLGITINATNGVVTWTPHEGNGGSTNDIHVVVTDDGFPALSTTQSVQVVVQEVNRPPILLAVNDRTVIEHELMQFNLPAIDHDIPANGLTFELLSGPTGMNLHPTSGILNWSPGEQAGGSIFPVSVRVIDDGVPALSATQTFAVTVLETNRAPVFPALTNQTITETNNLSVIVTADDLDDPTNTLTYSLVTGPAGMTIDPVTGSIAWQPNENDGGNLYVVRVCATDDGTPPMSVEGAFTLRVDEHNQPPVLLNATNRIIPELSTLSFQMMADDPDLPANQLSFLMTDGPIGAVLQGDGQFTWTPTEAQGPSTNSITVRVIDNGFPDKIDTATFTIIVTEANEPPVLNPITDRFVDEADTLFVGASGSDGDLPVQQLTYSLVQPPLGMTINPTNGLITYVTHETIGPATNTVTVRLTDDGPGNFFAEQSFQVVVREVNGSPTIFNAVNRSVAEESELSFVFNVTDHDLPTNQVNLRLEGTIPSGVQLDPITREFRWTPTEAQGPSNHVFTLIAQDNGIPSISVTQSFIVAVSEINQAPTLGAVMNQSVRAGQLLSITNLANDVDLPANQLTYELLSAPVGMAISPQNGILNWTPQPSQVGSHPIQLRVFDNGSPSLSATQFFNVQVNALTRPTLNISYHNGSAILNWNSEPGLSYRVRYSPITPAATNTWQPLAGDVTATTNHTQLIDGPLTGVPNRFYRLEILP